MLSWIPIRRGALWLAISSAFYTMAWWPEASRRRFLPFAFGAFFHAAIVDKQKAFLLCCYDKVKVITTAGINSVRTKFAFGRFPFLRIHCPQLNIIIRSRHLQNPTVGISGPLRRNSVWPDYTAEGQALQKEKIRRQSRQRISPNGFLGKVAAFVPLWYACATIGTKNIIKDFW